MAEPFRLEWRGAQALDAITRGALSGLAAAGDHLVGEVRREVPLDEGTLSRSVRADVDQSSMTLGISADTPYARVQHEDESLRHPGGRKAKYIEDPVRREGEVCLGIIGAACRQALGP